MIARSGDALGPPDLAAFDSRRLLMTDWATFAPWFEGTVTSITGP